MGDMGDLFRAHRERAKEKRSSNTKTSTRILTDMGVAYTSHNFGAHLVVEHAGRIIDFWPSTGLWMPRGTHKRGRGVYRLLTELGIAPPKRAANCKNDRDTHGKE